MNAWDGFWYIMGKAMEISVDLMGPFTVGAYVLVMVGLAALYHWKPRLANGLSIWVAVLFFFVIWNHPDFRWYRLRPWHGGYAYSWAMVLVYVLAPVVAGRLVRRLWLWLRGVDWGEKRRKGRDIMESKGE